MKKKKVTAREIILLVLLIILLAFYFVNKGPVERIIESFELQRTEIQNKVSAIEPQIMQMGLWNQELDRIYEKYNGRPKSIPEYDNINSVIAEMSVIFDGDITYSINFSDPSFSDHIATRNIRISFSCYSYAEAIAKLNQVNESENRYRITDMSISEGNNDYYSITMSITAYEYVPNDVQTK